MFDRRRFTASAALCGLTTGLAPQAGRAAAPDPAFAPVGDHVRALVEGGVLPFAALRVARHGRVLAEWHVSGREAVGPDTLYRIYSMTKPVVAAGVALLVEDGRLRLEAPVAALAPEFGALQAAMGAPDRLEPARPMTVAHLLTHACGLANSWGDSPVAPLYRAAGLTAGAWMHDPAVGGLDGFARRLAALPLACQPGTAWIYGYGLDVAGLIVERAAGERLGAFLHRRLFSPLGMAATGFHAPEARAGDLAGLYVAGPDGPRAVRDGGERAALRPPLADSGSGGLVSSLEDYGRFADMLAGGGVCNGVRVMRPETARLVTSPHGPQAALEPGLARFGRYAPGTVGQALGGVTRLTDGAAPGSTGEYAWGGAAGTGFWATPGLGLSMTFMTQLMAGSTTPRDALRPLIYGAIAAN